MVNMPEQMKKMANNESDYQQAKAILKSLKSGGNLFQQGAINDYDSYSVYDHMISVIKYLIERKPPKGYDEFEQISRLLKKEFSFENSKLFYDMNEFDPRVERRSSDMKSIQCESAKKELQLFVHPEHKWHDNPTVNQNEPFTNFDKNLDFYSYDSYIQSYGELSLLENVPVGLTKMEILRIWLCLRLLGMKLAQKGKIRFWGKFITLTGSYYIAERPSNDAGDDGDEIEAPWDVDESEETEEVQPKKKNVYPVEERGSGCNSWDYFITKELNGNDWKRLPQVTPEQIVSSKGIKIFLTGDLNGNLLREYGFSGLEAHYVRALISRIGHGSFIAPIGYDKSHDEEEEENERGFEAKDLLERGNWVHVRAVILDIGRTEWTNTNRLRSTLRSDEASSYDEEDVEEMEESFSRDGPVNFVNITEDKSIKIRNPRNESVPAWKLDCSSKLLPRSELIVIGKSNTWDDTFALVKKKDSLNIYLGWGLKRPDDDFHFNIFNEILTEYDMDSVNASKVKETIDPTPLEEAEYEARNRTPPDVSEESGEEDEQVNEED